MASDEKISTINFHDLRVIINKMFDHLEHDVGVTELDIGDSLYHDVDISEKFKNFGTPPQPSLGDLIDDLEFLQPLVEQDREMAVSLMFMHISPLLKYIAHRVGQ